MNQPKSFRSVRASLFQSAVHQVLQNKVEDASGLLAEHSMMQAMNRVLAASEAKGDIDLVSTEGTPEICAKLAIKLAEAKIEGNKMKAAELESELKFSNCDPGWLEAVAVYLEFYGISGKRLPVYKNYQDISKDFVYPLPQGKSPDTLTVGVLGDWGTGESVAQIVLDDLMQQAPDLIIHVGDVYYAGTEAQSESNFLNLLNQARQTSPVPIYNLPGNHDYYSGGQAFYDRLPQINLTPYAPEGTHSQEASYFCLRNDHWQLQGMDTGYFDHDFFKVGEDITRLNTSEVKWHLDKINSAGKRRIIFFSHHQLYSAFEKIGNRSMNIYLLQDFAIPLRQNRIAAWFWGHEHLLEVYQPYKGLAKGRCIGHGAFPQLVDSPYKIVSSNVPLLPDPNNPDTFIKLCTSGEVFNHGYAVLKLRDPGAQSKAYYYQIAGDGSSKTSSLVFSETI